MMFICILLLVTSILSAQGIAIGASEKTADDSAVLEMHSTEKGMLIPRMTEAQKDAIPSPAEGLTIYQTDAPEGIKFFDGNVWVDTETLSGAPASGSGSATGVSINATGAAADPSAMLDVSSTTQGFLPPRMTLVQRNAIASPAQGLMVYQTDNTKGLYVYDGSAWRALYYNHYVGESYGGGIVIYVDDSGLHGIIAAPVNTSGWYSWGFGVSGTTGDAVYDGYMNTMKIDQLVNPIPEKAASAALNYSYGGYDDWHLPSQNEMELIYTNKGLLGSFPSSLGYWTSTETDPSNAYCYEISSGQGESTHKETEHYVRAVRYF